MSEYCQPCKDEGRGLVIAHYASVPAGRSATGKAIPATCWHHHFGKPLPAISAAPVVNAPDSELSKQQEPTAPHKEERKERMNPTDGAPRICGHDGCGKTLNANNKSGFCSAHFYDSIRKTPANDGGTNHRARTPRKSRVSSPRRSVAKPRGVATICVTEANLDNFWSKLSLEEKAQLYQLQLENA